MRAKRATILLLLGSSLAVLIFMMGFIMGKEIYKRKIIAALKDDDTKTAAFTWVEMKGQGIDVTKDPLFFLSMAKSFLKKGDLEGVKFNLDKMVELLGK